MALDIKNCYLSTTLADKQHMFIQADSVPEEMLQACKLQSKTHNNKMHTIIDKGMHGLKEAGALSCDELRQHLR